MGEVVEVDEKGRIVIPGDVRDKLGLKKGDSISLEVQDHSIVLAKLETEPIVGGNENMLKSFLSD